MAEVHGSCDDRFSGVREAFARGLDGGELGASLAVDLDGETVVDLWGGYRDQERTTPWTEDTIVNGWSTTKTVLALAALLLVERGDLDLYAPVGFGIGFCLGSPIIPYVPEGRTLFWGGWGGSLVVMDLDRRLTIAYLMNRMAPGILGSDRSEAYVRAVYAALG